VVAARWFAELCSEENPSPVGAAIWGDTRLLLPEELAGRRWIDLLNGGQVAAEGTVLSMAYLMEHFPLGAVFSDGAAKSE